MKLDADREVLCTLALPLPLTLFGEMGPAIEKAAERAGYCDVDLLTDGTNRIVARRKRADETAAPCWLCGSSTPNRNCIACGGV